MHETLNKVKLVSPNVSNTNIVNSTSFGQVTPKKILKKSIIIEDTGVDDLEEIFY